ncbi:TIGR04197 family type VII secretion effector [Streptococcus oricebi]|uniref:TIGR04197 family type VII secretion effector n=1 Tax=Streptococcus oricebi TaxID=1547447 RepID=A0ABS5B3W9_9STRE|nr:TIGR04197 family type VII secretion effector [Streptococcus oricebi]MBP2623515.1 hypothetical protein [Streptococcus oricebi]
MTIQSKTSTVQGYTSALNSATAKISATQGAVKDEATNLLGNEKAHETIDSIVNNLTRLVTTFTTASSNLEEVAKIFDQVDAERAKGIDRYYKTYR